MCVAKHRLMLISNNNSYFPSIDVYQSATTLKPHDGFNVVVNGETFDEHRESQFAVCEAVQLQRTHTDRFI